jgi:hypothetical protein
MLVLGALAVAVCATQVRAAARGAFSDLLVGRGVEIEGTTSGAQGMQATRIEVRQSAEGDQEVTGIVEAVDAAGKTITVLGIRIATDAHTLFEKEDGVPGAFSSLQKGQRIKAEGELQGDRVLAAEQIKIKETKDKAKIQGKIEGVDQAGRTLTVMGFTVSVTPATVIEFQPVEP